MVHELIERNRPLLSPIMSTQLELASIGGQVDCMKDIELRQLCGRLGAVPVFSLSFWTSFYELSKKIQVPLQGKCVCVIVGLDMSD